MRLAVKFGRSLKLNEELFDAVRAAKAAAGTARPSTSSRRWTKPKTLTRRKSCCSHMHWLKARGRPAQLVPPNLGFKKRQAYPESRAALEIYASQNVAGSGVLARRWGV